MTRRGRTDGRIKWAVVGTIVAGITIFSYWTSGRVGPVDVARRAARALEVRDADELAKLASVDERTNLNLTPANVRAFLSDTIWKQGSITGLEIKRYDQYPIDQILFDLAPPTPGRTSLVYPIQVITTQAPDGRWSLALGLLLLNSVYAANGGVGEEDHSRQVKRIYRDLALKHGIKGIRDNLEGYTFISDGG